MKRGQCKGCREPVLFTDTVTGSSMPINPTPDESGNIEIDAQGRARVLGKVPKDGKRRYTSHFATCPNAKQFRRARS